MRFRDGDDVVFYVNPEGLEESLLQKMKQDILASAASDAVLEDVVFAETNCARFRDILAQARADGLTSIFFILDRASAQKRAVLAVEPTHYSGEEKGIEVRFPCAASTRKFYIDPKQAASMGCNLNLGNMGWEEWAADVGRGDVFRDFP